MLSIIADTDKDQPPEDHKPPWTPQQSADQTAASLVPVSAWIKQEALPATHTQVGDTCAYFFYSLIYLYLVIVIVIVHTRRLWQSCC